MKFCLIINAGLQWRASLSHALNLARTMSQAGHQVNSVFFFGHAVKVIQLSEELSAWQQWHDESQCQLMLCSTLLATLGVDMHTDSKGFDVVGMASLDLAMAEADRTVELT